MPGSPIGIDSDAELEPEVSLPALVLGDVDLVLAAVQDAAGRLPGA
jgi:hypothetical protein